MRDALGYSIPNEMILGYILLSYIFLNSEESIALSVSFVLFSTGVQTTFAITIALIFLILKNYKEIKFTKLLIPILLICLWELVHLYIAPSSILEYIRYLIVYLYAGIVIFSKNLKINPFLTVKTFIYLNVSVCFIILFQTLRLLNMDLRTFLTSGVRLGFVEQLPIVNEPLLSFDPNLLAQNISLAIAACVTLLIKGYYKKTLLCSMLILILMGILTLSKTFLVSLLLIILIVIASLIFSNLNNVKKILFNFLGVSTIFGFILVIGFLFFKDTFLILIDRFKSGDITTGRVEAFNNYNSFLNQHFEVTILGIGIQNIGEKSGLISSPHTSLQEIILSWGIVGLILVLLFIVFLFRKAYFLSNSIKMVNYTTFLVFMFMSQSTQLFRLRDRILIFVLVLMTLILKDMKEEVGDEEKSITNSKHRTS